MAPHRMGRATSPDLSGGKGEQGVLEAIKCIEHCLPFPWRGFDCDNGYFTDRKRPVQYTRSQEYYKNGNAHIEGKNWTNVRHYPGYQRFEEKQMTSPLNDLYTRQWRHFMNFFLPSVKLLSKERIGSKIIKKHDEPQTTVERLLASDHIPDEVKQGLRAQRQTLDPFLLQRQISIKIKEILRRATPLPLSLKALNQPTSTTHTHSYI